MYIRIIKVASLLKCCGALFLGSCGFSGCDLLEKVIDLLFGWKNWVGKHSLDVWNMVPFIFEFDADIMDGMKFSYV